MVNKGEIINYLALKAQIASLKLATDGSVKENPLVLRLTAPNGKTASISVNVTHEMRASSLAAVAPELDGLFNTAAAGLD